VKGLMVLTAVLFAALPSSALAAVVSVDSDGGEPLPFRRDR
jgi:hypothetical protein